MRNPGQRAAVAAALVAQVALLFGFTSPARAGAPAWGIEVTPANAYGAQALGCPSEKEEPRAVPPCGVDPFTLSGSTFDRESAFNSYKIIVKNTGEAPTVAGPVTVVDRLPPGLVLAGERETGEEKAEIVSGPGWTCQVIRSPDAVSGANTALCTEESSLAPEKTYPPITLHVYVRPEAGDLVQNEVTVAGGGPQSKTKYTPTAIGEVPFGIESFTTALEEPGLGGQHRLGGEPEPSIQAAGHPIALTTSFVLNTVPNRSGQLEGARSGPKEVQVQLPPGLIGNPQNVAGECPLQLLHPLRPVAGAPNLNEEPCSLLRDGHVVVQGVEDAVGYVALYTSRRIVGGKVAPLPGQQAGNSRLRDSNLESSLIYNLKPSHGHAAEFGFFDLNAIPFVLEAKLRSGGDYGVTVGDAAAGPVLGVRATFCAYGVQVEPLGSNESEYRCRLPDPGQKPFLTNPTACTGPAPLTTLLSSSWAESDQAANEELQTGETVEGPFASMGAYSGAPSAAPSFVGPSGSGTSATPESSSFVTGCEKLSLEPQLSLQPTSAEADAPTGLRVDLKVPHTNEPARWGTNEKGEPGFNAPNSPPALKSSVVRLPEGMAVSPAGADGLQACTNAQFGLTEFEAHGTRPPPGGPETQTSPAECPAASQIGTVKVTTPLLAQPLVGQVFVGQPECSPCRENQFQKEGAEDAAAGRIFRLFLQVSDPAAGVIVKLVGDTRANEVTGRLETTFENQPQTPFELLEMKLKDGATASLQNPQSCGPTSLYADFTPWSAPGLGGPSGSEEIKGTPDTVFEEPAFTVTGCSTPQPFAAAHKDLAFEAGTEDPQAAAYSPFTVNLSREDGEQNLQSVKVQMPPGLTAKIAGVPECEEAQANAGSCPPSTQIGTATAGAGPGPHPFFERGPVYFTGPYKGAPFGLEIVIPAVAGPFNLGDIVVRQAIAVDKNTTAASVTSDPMPQIHDGVPLRLKKINVSLTAPNFILNPTNCSQQAIAATLTSTLGQVATPAFPYSARGCQNLAFHPSLTASTRAKTSKALGASLNVKVTAKPGEANIAKTELIIPSILPSRLTTLQKACVDAVFNQDPANCPEGSVIGQATARTPLLSDPVSGPAILVSHGGAAFPDVIFVLQGQGIRLDLDGGTDIKGQVTYSKFETVPDTPVESFETNLPEGPHSIFTANGSLCKAKISIPTTITAQNGAVIKQMTKVSVTGCPKALTRAQKLAAALKACKKKPKRQQKACERAARRAYAAAVRKAKKARKATVKPASASTSSPGSATGASPQPAPSGALPAISGAVAAGAARSALTAGRPLESCSPVEEKLKQESNLNRETGVPYSAQLPECRAYEMVSPLEKQAHGVEAPPEGEGFPVSPSGETAGFTSEGDFAEPQNFLINFVPSNPYISERTATGWTTRSALAPAQPIGWPSLAGLAGDFTPDMRSARVSCGRTSTKLEFACALREGAGPWASTPWASTPLYTSNVGTGVGGSQDYLGASSDLSRLFIQPTTANLLPEDTAQGQTGIYEIRGPAGASPQLRLVNVGNDRGSEKEGELTMPSISGAREGPLLGDARLLTNEVPGTAYHAISEDGQTVFFTATPTARQQGDLGVSSEAQTVYARIRHGEGAGETAETVAVSNPRSSECAKCNPSTPQPATFQGASANGEKVFFTTSQTLLNNDSTSNLYEYDFEKPAHERLVLLSADVEPEGARVRGVVRTSSDGSHVYFVARGVLASRGVKGADNLYAVDTNTEETKFVAKLAEQDSALWGEGGGVLEGKCGSEPACDAASREAQTTPDGRYLVFSTYAHPNEADTNPAQAVYRYSFEGGPDNEGKLTWVSHGAPGFKEYCEGQPNAEDKEKSASEKEHCEHEGQNAIITPLNGQTLGASAGVGDWGRAISSDEEGGHDGEYVIFTTAEKLQQGDINEKPDVYLWHCPGECQSPEREGVVAMISDGHDPEGVDLTQTRHLGFPGMSASGSDVFFTTHTRLVAQDGDELGDLYDARIGGGFPRPRAAVSCLGEGERETSCQQESQEQRELGAGVFGALGSFVFAGANLGSPAPASPASANGSPKLRIALGKLERDGLQVTVKTSAKGTVTITGRGLKPTSRSVADGAHLLRVPLTAAGRALERVRATTRLKATLKVGTATVSATVAVRL